MRLRLGRFAWELYYAKTRAVLPKEEVRRRVALVCGHLGYVTGIFEYIMTDMFWLRVFSIAGCGLICGYQMAQPRILYTAAFWNGTFALINVYQLHILCRRLPAMTEEEQLLFEALGGEARLARRAFQELLEVGTWHTYEAGELLAKEGATAEAPQVCLLAAGACEVQLGGLALGRLGPGSVIGEVWELDLDHAAGGVQAEPGGDTRAAWAATVATVPSPPVARLLPRPSSATVAAGRQGARCFCIPLRELRESSHLHEALYGIFATALADKIHSIHQDRRLLQYRAVLEVACAAGEDPPATVFEAVARYRRQHGVTDDEHFRATKAVPRCVSSRFLRV